MNKNFKYIILLFILLFFQFFIFDKLFLIYLPNIYIYIFFILILPYNTNKTLLLFISFLLGLFMDFTNYTPGLHATVTTFIGFLRPKILAIYSPITKYEDKEILGHKKYGWTWFLKYYSSIILIHNSLIIILQYFTFYHFLYTLSRILLSFAISFAFIFIIYSFFIRQK